MLSSHLLLGLTSDCFPGEYIKKKLKTQWPESVNEPLLVGEVSTNFYISIFLISPILAACIAHCHLPMFTLTILIICIMSKFHVMLNCSFTISLGQYFLSSLFSNSCNQFSSLKAKYHITQPYIPTVKAIFVIQPS